MFGKSEFKVKAEEGSGWVRVDGIGGKVLDTLMLYQYLKINGGWLVVVGKDNLAFIPDPEHKNPPVPIK